MSHYQSQWTNYLNLERDWAEEAGKIQPQNEDQGFHTPYFEQILNRSRTDLNAFVETLGTLKHEPLFLSAFEADLKGISDDGYIDLDVLNQFADNSIRKMKANRKIKNNWSRQDLLIMLWVVDKYCQKHNMSHKDFKQIDWDRLGKLIPGKNGEQAMFKWMSLKSNRALQKHPWMPWEDAYLSRSVSEANEKHWLRISKELYYLKENTAKVYRTAKQCRQRWACYVKSGIKKGEWSRKEDLVLIDAYLRLGKKWSIITKSLRGRTQNAVKNRWKLISCKRKNRRSDISLDDFLVKYKKHLWMLETEEAESTQNHVREMYELEADQKSSKSNKAEYSLSLISTQNSLSLAPIKADEEEAEKIIADPTMLPLPIIYCGQNEFMQGGLRPAPSINQIDQFFCTDEDIQRLSFDNQ